MSDYNPRRKGRTMTMPVEVTALERNDFAVTVFGIILARVILCPDEFHNMRYGAEVKATEGDTHSTEFAPVDFQVHRDTLEDIAAYFAEEYLIRRIYGLQD